MSNAPKRALIVIDVQNEYFSGNLRIEYPPVGDSLPNILHAMDAAHAAGIPVVVVRHLAPAGAPIFAPGSHGVELHPQVAERPRDLLLDKSKASALSGTGLGDWLRERGVDTLTLVGYMTHNCDDSTAARPPTKAGRWNSSTTPAARCPTPTARARPLPRKSTGCSAWCCIRRSPRWPAPPTGWRRWQAARPWSATTSTPPTSVPSTLAVEGRPL